MAQPFQLTAQVNFQAPQLTRFATQIRQQLQNQLNVNVNVNSGKANQQLKNTANQTSNVAKQANQAAGAMNKFGKQLKGAVFYALRTQLAYAAIRIMTRGISDATSAALQFERQMIKVSQVTGKSVKQLQGLQRSISDISTGLGVSSSSLVDVTRILAQTGLSANDTRIAMEALAKTTLAPTFDDIKNTAETAVAVMRQFKIEASGLDRVLGQINAVAGQFAVEASDIGTAIKRAGGAFRAAGGSVEELIALFTSVRSTTRETAETIATGFRTIFTRLQRPTTIKFLRQFGVELQGLDGKFVGSYDAVRRLNAALASLDPRDIRYSMIIEQLGGFRQVSKVIPMIQQFSEAEKARAVAMAESGSLDRDAQTAQKATIVRMQRLTETVKELFRTITATKGFQVFVDMMIKIANAAIKVADALSPLIPVIGMLAVGMAGRFAAKGFGKMLGFNRGGVVPGSGNTDSVPAVLTPGEFVLRKSAVQSIGTERLHAMNKYSAGNKVRLNDSLGMLVRKTGDGDPRDFNKSSVPITKVRQTPAIKRLRTLDPDVRFTAPVDVSQFTRSEGFKKMAEDPIESTVIKSRKKLSKSSKRAEGNAMDLAMGKKFSQGMGQLFEDYVIAISKADKPGNRDFDLTPDSVINASLSRYTKEDVQPYTDIKLSGTNKAAQDVIKKGVNQGLFKNAIRSRTTALSKRKTKKANTGGGIYGSDSVPALLTPGEFVVNAKSAKSIGYGNLSRMNRHGAARFNKGGIVGFNTGSAGPVGGGMGGIGGMMGKLTNALFIFTMLPAVLQAVADSASNVVDSISGQNESIAENIKLFGSLAVATGLLIAAKQREALAGMFSNMGGGGFASAMKATAAYQAGSGPTVAAATAMSASPAAAALSKRFASIGKSLTGFGTKLQGASKVIGPVGTGLAKAGGIFTQAAAGAVGPLIALTAGVGAAVIAFAALYAAGSKMSKKGQKAIEEGRATSTFLGVQMEAENMVYIGEFIKSALKVLAFVFMGPVGWIMAVLEIANFFSTVAEKINAAKNKFKFDSMINAFNSATKAFEAGGIEASSYVVQAGRTLAGTAERLYQVTNDEDRQNALKARTEVIKGTVAGLDKLVKDVASGGRTAAEAQALFATNAENAVRQLALMQGIPFHRLKKQYMDQVKAQALANQRTKEMADTIAKMNALRSGMNYLFSALENYSKSLDIQKTALDNLSATADNASLSLGKFVKLDVTKRGMIGQSAGIMAGFQATSTIGGASVMGGIGTAAGVTASIADVVQSDLQNIIADASLTQLGEGEEIEDVVRKKLEDKLKEAKIDIKLPEVQAQLDAFSAKLGNMANDADGAKKTLKEFVDADIEGATKKLIEGLPGTIAVDLFNTMREIISKQNAQLAQALKKRTDLEQKYIKALGAVVSVQQDNAKIIREMTGGSIAAGQPQADFERRQNVLLSNTRLGSGAGLSSVGAAAGANRDRMREIANRLNELAQLQSDQGGGLNVDQIRQQRALLDESETLRSEFQSLTQVLENYKSSTELLAQLQERLSKARKEREAKGSMAEDIMFGDASSSNRAIRTALATRRTQETGSLAGLSRERQKDVIGFLRAQGKGKEAEQLMISEFQRRYAGQADPAMLESQAKALFEASKTEVDIMREIRDVLKDREEAAKILAELQGQALDDMNKVIANQNATFLAELKKIMLDAQKGRLEQEERTAKVNLTAAESNRDAANKIKNDFGLSVAEFDKINTESGRNLIKRIGTSGMTAEEREMIAGLRREENTDAAGFGASQNLFKFFGDEFGFKMEDLIDESGTLQLADRFFSLLGVSDAEVDTEVGRQKVAQAIEEQMKRTFGDTELGAQIIKEFRTRFANMGEFDDDMLGDVLQASIMAGVSTREANAEAIREEALAAGISSKTLDRMLESGMSFEELSAALSGIPLGPMSSFGEAVTNANNALDAITGSLTTLQTEINEANQKLSEARTEAETIANQKAEERRNQAEAVTSRYAGGMIYASTGAFIRKGTDTIPAMLTPGEFVVRKAAVDAVGVSTLRSINNMGRAGTKRRGGNGYYADGDLASGGGVAMIDASQFDKSIQRFSVQIDRLSDVLRGGFSVDVGGTINVDVHLNGAEWLSEAEGAIGEIAAGKVRQGINSMLKKHFPKLGRDSEVIGKRRSKTIETNVQT